MRRIHPALEMLMMPRWDAALDHLYTTISLPTVSLALLTPISGAANDRDAVQSAISDLVENLYAIGIPQSGRLAMAWQMMTVDPRRPASFVPVLPQLQQALDVADDIDERAHADMRERIRIWWRASEGEWVGSEVSIFRIAERETQRDPDDLPDPDLQPSHPPRWTSKGVIASVDQPPAIPGPTLVVMPKLKATKLNNHHAAFKDIVDAALPLVVACNVAGIRATLHAEFPHAVTAVDLLLRDLREGRPFWLKPVILVGSFGAGKSRLVRRLADLVGGLYVHRCDGASSNDAVGFSGSSKSWSNTEPSVPMRAIAQSRTANPLVLVDEIDKASAGTGGNGGRLWDGLVGFLDRETSKRYRDNSLDAEVDLGMVSFAATANSVERLPPPLRDRFRIIKVPDPGLQHLPQLAAQVMADMAAEDEARSGDQALAGDELDVIGKAWAQAGFSMRKLQKIVTATLDARDSYAQRH